MAKPNTSSQITLDQFKTLTEKQWLTQVVELARLLGWATYHPWLSIHSASGWPDLALVRERLILAELKAEKGKVSIEQRLWLDRLTVAGVENYIWKPSNFEEIVTILTRRDHARIAQEVPVSSPATHR
jgi:hypothetical protein